jgi:hypothetical protein
MPILNVNTNIVGQSGVKPTFIFIDTNDTYYQVKSVGYLNKLAKDNIQLEDGMMALVNTKPSPTSRITEPYFFAIRKTGETYSLFSPNGILAGTKIFAGGSTSTIFNIPGLTFEAVGTCSMRSSANAVFIRSAVPGTNILTVTWSGDPGAGTAVDYNYLLNDNKYF